MKSGKKSGIEDALSDLANSWGDAEESTGHVDIPDGRYIVRIESATVNRAKASGRLQVSWDLVIAEGEYVNRHLFSHNGIADSTGLGFLRGALARLGMEWPSSPSELPEILEQCVNLHAQVNVKTKERNGSEFQNTYFTRVLPEYQPEADNEAEEEEAPAPKKKPAPAPAPKASKPAPEPEEEESSSASAPAPAIGAKVEVDYDGTMYRGTVKSIDEDEGVATVKFEDGTQDTLSFDSLTVVKTKTAPPSMPPKKPTKAAPVEEEEATVEGVEVEFADDDFNKKQTAALHTQAGRFDLDPDDYESSCDLIVDVAEAAGLSGSFDDVGALLKQIEAVEVE